jgi:gamma-glutamylcyclotransferase (GGCT)/AIG2-like uncharacterized protein YtfP
METEPSYLFTYGTLMKRFDNPFAIRLKNASTYLDEGHFPGLLYQVSWYPGAVYQSGLEQRVYGEIYQLTDAANLLIELDDYEDVRTEESQSLYLRKIVTVTLTDLSTLPCWIYLYNQPVEGLRQIAGGKF